MRIQIILLLTIVFALSCDSQTPIRSNVPVSEDMEHFLNMLNGNQKDATNALLYYGATEEIRHHNMALYELDEPMVLSRNHDCYQIIFKSGMTNRAYQIKWNEGKISEITDHGIQ